MDILVYVVGCFGVGIQLFGVFDCVRNEDFGKVSKTIYVIIILVVPLIGLFLYLRDKQRFRENSLRLQGRGGANPWEQ